MCRNDQPAVSFEDVTVRNRRSAMLQALAARLKEVRPSVDAKDDFETKQNKSINGVYKICIENDVFLSDILYSRSLEWPTLTLQRLLDVKEGAPCPHQQLRLPHRLRWKLWKLPCHRPSGTDGSPASGAIHHHSESAVNGGEDPENVLHAAGPGPLMV